MSILNFCHKIGLVLVYIFLIPSSAHSVDDIRETPVVKAVRKVSPAIVNISTERIITVRDDPFYGYHRGLFDDFPARTRKFRTSSLGSGVLIDDDGYILTNDHVISKASKIIVTLSDGTEREGTLLSTYGEKDLAVVKIEGDEPFPFTQIGRSDDLMIGETVIAVGNPYGLGNTVTTGVLSARDRFIESQGRVVFDNLLQTDAAINPGNSGGALLNIKGELIGINTAILAQAEGIGFAIPVDTVKSVLETLLDPRKVKKVWFGGEYRTIDKTFAEEKGLDPYEGIYITAIEEGSPAEKSGLHPGDVILEVDGNPVDCVFCYYLLLLDKDPGDTIEVAFRRDEKTESRSVTLAKLPKPSPHGLALKKLGLDVGELTPQISSRLRIDVDEGVLISKVTEDGPADERGIEVGDVIIQLGEHRVRSLDDVAIILDRTNPGDSVALSFIRGQYIIRTRITAQ